MEPEPVHCVRCRQRCYAPRFHSEYRRDGPRREWGRFYQIVQGPPPEGQPADDGLLYFYCVCQPTCRANAAVARYEAARIDVGVALEQLQAAVIDALAEVGEAWQQLDE